MWWIIGGILFLGMVLSAYGEYDKENVKRNPDGHTCDFQIIEEHDYFSNEDLDYVSYEGTKYTHKCKICGKVVERWYKL
jgi:hypothetical protein